jgi:cytoskeletal protein CcmA (bactofilin family)
MAWRLQGTVVGADKIYIRNGARFLGDIRALGIVIEDGGFICGKVDPSRHPGVDGSFREP